MSHRNNRPVYITAVKKFILTVFAILCMSGSGLKAQPEWVPGTPSLGSPGPLTIPVNYGINKVGTIYILITNMDYSATWTPAEIKYLALNPSALSSIVGYAIVSINDELINSVLTNVFDVVNTNTTHTVYLVAENISEGLQTTSIRLQTKTLSCPTAIAGLGGNSCGLSFKLNATAPTWGTGTWTQTSGPGTSTTSPDPNTPDATVTVSQYGTYTYTWTVVYRTCTTISSPVTVTFYEQPVTDAGPGVTICSDSPFTVSEAKATGYASLLWTHNGTGTLSGASTITPTYTPAATDEGRTVTLTLNAKNGTCPDAVSSMNISVDALPKANAGNDKNECGLESKLRATPSIGTGNWSVISGPGTVAFDPDVNTPDPKIKADTYGVYVFRWTEVNGTCTSSDDVTVDFNENPSPVSAGNDQVVCGLSATMAGTAYKYLDPPNDHSGSTRVWSQVSGPGSATFATPDSPLSAVTVNTYGTYIFRWTETNGSSTESDDVTVDFNEAPAGTCG